MRKSNVTLKHCQFQHDRIESMKLLLGKKLKISESVDWNYFGNKTEGWVMQDLVDLTEKAAFHAWKRHGNFLSPIIFYCCEQ